MGVVMMEMAAKELANLRNSRLMTYKQYADMIRFLRQNCSDGVELTLGAGATHSENKEINSKDAFLLTLALHLQRLQRIPDPSLEQHEISLVHRWFAVHRTLLFPTKKSLLKETPQVRLSSCKQRRERLTRTSPQSPPLRSSCVVHRRSFTAPPLVPMGMPTSTNEQSHDSHMTPSLSPPPVDAAPVGHHFSWTYQPLRPIKRSDFSQAVFKSSSFLAIDLAIQRVEREAREAEWAEFSLNGRECKSSGDVSPEVGTTAERWDSQVQKTTEDDLQRMGLEQWIQGLEQWEEPPHPQQVKDDVIQVSMAPAFNSKKLLPLMEEDEEEGDEEEVKNPSTTVRLPAILPTVNLGFTSDGVRGGTEGLSLWQQPRVPKKLVPVVAGFRVERYAFTPS